MFQFQYFKIPRTLSRNYCSRALEALEKAIPSTTSGGQKNPQEGIINLIVVNPEEMAQMNKKFRGKDGPTDILTFSYRESVTRGRKKGGVDDFFLRTNNQKLITKNFVVGEIYLCLEKIKLYAEEARKAYKEQLEYIIIHGLVHMMGYDHESESDWQEMEKVEKKIQSLLK